MVSKWCLGGFKIVSERQVSTGCFWSTQVRTDQVKTRQVRKGLVETGPLWTCQVRIGEVK